AVETCGARLDEVEDPRFEADAVQAVDLLDARRARHVHLGHEPVDDVESDEVEAVGLELRRHPAADLAVAGVDRGALDAPAHVDVAAVLVLARDAEDRAERLAREDDEALVALA